jgi:hypothetical protein
VPKVPASRAGKMPLDMAPITVGDLVFSECRQEAAAGQPSLSARAARAGDISLMGGKRSSLIQGVRCRGLLANAITIKPLHECAVSALRRGVVEAVSLRIGWIRTGIVQEPGLASLQYFF